MTFQVEHQQRPISVLLANFISGLAFCPSHFHIIHHLVYTSYLREERRSRVSESRVLRRIFGRKRDEVRVLHNEELNDL